MDLLKLSLKDITSERTKSSKSPSAINLGGAVTIITIGKRKFIVQEGRMVLNFTDKESNDIDALYGWEAYQKRNLNDNKKLLLKYIKEGLIKL